MKCSGAHLLLLSVLLSGWGLCSSSRILAVFPTFFRSHWLVGEAIVKALGEGGHAVTVIAPFPVHNCSEATCRTVLLEGLLEAFPAQNMLGHEWFGHPVHNQWTVRDLGVPLVSFVMQHPSVQALLAEPETGFDLVLVESFAFDALLGFGGLYDAPLITVSPMGVSAVQNDQLGNPAPPSQVPNFYMPFCTPMTFWQRLLNHGMAVLDYVERHCKYYPRQEELHRQFFPGHRKSLRQVMREDVSLGFVNSHHSFSFPYASVPTLIEIGGIHIDRAVGELPEDIRQFLDGATEGAVLFSMGSFLQASDLTDAQREALVGAFKRLKQKVIWRYNLPDAAQLPGNILTREWLPQKEILAHPNVRLFITHGGMLGTTESVFHGKPMIGIPVFGDQHLNIARAVQRGYALRLDKERLHEGQIVAAVERILGDASFAERAQQLSALYRDQPLTPQQSVLYWSEYVLRHQGAKHLRVEGVHMHWFAYHGLDVWAVLLLAFVALCVLPPWLLLQWGLRRCRAREGRKREGKLKRK